MCLLEAPDRLVWFPAISAGTDVAAVRPAVPKLVRVDDADLLTRAQAGDTNAVALLFDRYSRLVLAIGFRVLRDRGEAEDLVQDTFLRLCQRPNTFDASKGSARTWMFQFAYRRALDRRAYLMRRCFYSDGESSRLARAVEEATTGNDRLTASLIGDEIHAAFETLSTKQRATLELFFFENFNLREVAERIGESFENTRNHYYRGLRQLRKVTASADPVGQ